MDIIYMGSRKRQNLLNYLGAWGSWEKVEEGRKGGEQRKIYTSMKTIFKNQEMTKTTDFLESHPRFHCPLGLLTLACTPRRYDQVSVKQEFLWIVLLCHGNAQLSLSFVSCLTWTVYCQ